MILSLVQKDNFQIQKKINKQNQKIAIMFKNIFKFM